MQRLAQGCANYDPQATCSLQDGHKHSCTVPSICLVPGILE